MFRRDLASGINTRVSISVTEKQGDRGSAQPSISGNGRRVAFYSNSTNLLGDGVDVNGVSDIYVRDLGAPDGGTTYRVSETEVGAAANGASEGPSISYDGTLVAFQSIASNLYEPDYAATWDVYVKDLQTGKVELASKHTDGTRGNAHSTHPSISADGRYVAFRSTSTNLVGGDSNGRADIFVHDLEAGTTDRVSVARDGSQANRDSFVAAGNAISAHGRFVTFQSTATRLVDGNESTISDVFVRDRVNKTTIRVSIGLDGFGLGTASNSGALSPDGRYVGFQTAAGNVVTADGNGTSDAFVYDRWTGKIARASVSSNGSEGPSPSSTPTSFSRHGRHVIFESASSLAPPAGDNIDVYFRDIGVDGPDQPLGFRVTDTTRTTVSLSWSDVFFDETGYRLERSADDFATMVSWDLGPDAVTFVDTGLETGTAYSYRLRAVNSAGASGYAALQVRTDDALFPDVTEAFADSVESCSSLVTSESTVPAQWCVLELMHDHQGEIPTTIQVEICIAEHGAEVVCQKFVFTAPANPPPIPDEDDPSVPPPTPAEGEKKWVPPVPPGDPEWTWDGDIDAGFPTSRGSWWRLCGDDPTKKEYLHWDAHHADPPGPHWGYKDCLGGQWDRLFDGPNAWIPYER